MRDCREKWRICEGNREFILETLELIKCIFVILLKVSAGQVGLIGWGGAGWVGANTHYSPTQVIGAKVLPLPRPATSMGWVKFVQFGAGRCKIAIPTKQCIIWHNLEKS